MIPAVLGIDSSTQSSTVEVRALQDGTLLGGGTAPHPVTYPPVSEQEPEEWWRATVAATRQALTVLDVEVVGVSVGAQCHGLVVTGDDDTVLRPAKLWNDTTSASQADRLAAAHDVAWWIEQVGIAPSAAVTITKLAWLHEHEPDTLERAAHLCVPHDWLTFRLTGRHVTDRSDASGTGYFSADTMRWRTDILDALIARRDWSSLLPTVLGPDEPAGIVTADAATELGISPRALVGPGGGDQHLAAQGIGLEPGDIAYSIGTSGVVFATSAEPVPDMSGDLDNVANVTGGYLPLVCTLNSTRVTDTVRALLAVGHEEMATLALAASVDPERPLLAAYLDGERSPRLPRARGMLAGLTSATTREALALSAFEGVALGLVRGERRMADRGLRPTGRTILLGGGARSAAFRQVIADLTGREVVTVEAPEGTARGAAIQAAAVATGRTVVDVTAEWRPDITSRTSPVADRNDVWDRYLALADLQADGRTF